jgi:hypothetical protein
MYEIAMIGLLSAVGAFILIWKINLRFFCSYHWQADVMFTLLVSWLFFGTFSGMATAAVAGVVFSALLYCAKLINDNL